MGVASKSAGGKSSAKSGAKTTSKFPKSTTSSAKKTHKKTGAAAVQHKPKPGLIADKKTKIGKRKPPHMKYTEAQLKVPKLNGIVPAGVSKMPNMKKGKNFVDDREGMNAIMALVMAEKEGNIESKMIKARQMEEVREARKLEMEKRAGEKREGFEERKKGIKEAGKKQRQTDGTSTAPTKKESSEGARSSKSKSKRVSFG